MKVRALIKEPGKPAEERYIENSLEEVQSIVGGHIEGVPFFDMHFYVNDEGKLKGLEPNFILFGRRGADVIVGPAVFLRADDEGNDIDLTMTDIVKLKNLLQFDAIAACE